MLEWYLVSVSSKVIEDNKRQILFIVKDTGIGIPQGKMNQLFPALYPA